MKESHILKLRMKQSQSIVILFVIPVEKWNALMKSHINFKLKKICKTLESGHSKL